MSPTLRTARLSTLALAGAIALSACASKPDPNSFGGRLALEGGAVAAIGDDWNAAQAMAANGRELVEDGEAQVKKGEKQIATGESNVDDGRRKVKKGERMILDGERKAAEAEALYNKRIQGAALRATPTL